MGGLFRYGFYLCRGNSDYLLMPLEYNHKIRISGEKSVIGSGYVCQKNDESSLTVAGGALTIFGKRSAAPHLRTIGPAYVYEVRGADPLVQISGSSEAALLNVYSPAWFGTLVTTPVNGYDISSTQLSA